MSRPRALTPLSSPGVCDELSPGGVVNALRRIHAAVRKGGALLESQPPFDLRERVVLQRLRVI